MIRSRVGHSDESKRARPDSCYGIAIGILGFHVTSLVSQSRRFPSRIDRQLIDRPLSRKHRKGWETMALKGKPRDMNKWREVLLDPNVHFPGESSEYRRARNELLEAEAELRRHNEQVAAQRRALPAGGLVREDYVFESAADGSKVRFSELFAPGKNSLVIYNMMFPRWSEDRRAGAPGGQDSRAAAYRAAVPVMHIDRRWARGCCFSPRRADQPRRDREDKP
jgi:Bacterial protein of unknown function (DUF899)